MYVATQYAQDVVFAVRKRSMTHQRNEYLLGLRMALETALTRVEVLAHGFSRK
jgi:hypothetical protein